MGLREDSHLPFTNFIPTFGALSSMMILSSDADPYEGGGVALQLTKQGSVT
jgi:hypothetical protein